MDPHALTALGLSRYEAKAYLALVRRNRATPAEVAQLSGLPRQRVYDVLKALDERSLVEAERSGGTLRYSAVPPDVVAARLTDERRVALANAEESASRWAADLLPVWLQSRDDDQHPPLRYIEVLRDRDAASARVGKIYEEVEEEFLVVVRPPYFGVPDADEDPSVPHRLRAIYDRSALDVPGLGDYIRREAATEAEVRIGTHLPVKLAIADRRFVIIHLPDPVAGEDSFTTLVIEHPDMAALAVLAFEATWRDAVPLD